MDCIICNAKNDEAAKYCSNCGARLDLRAGPTKEMVEAAVRQEVELVFQRYVKDQKIAEFDVTEKVANRLVGWGKIFGTLIGFVLVLAGVLGVKSYDDIKKDLQTIAESLNKQATNVKDEITKDSKELADL